MQNKPLKLSQLAIALGTLVIAAVWAYGAKQIPSEAGYAGIGADFVPWLVSIVMAVCGAWLLWEVLTGGFRNYETASDDEPASGIAFVYLSAGVILNAILIERIGFILSCALCFVFAVRGIRVGQGRSAGNAKSILIDMAIGLCISAPVFWLFTKGLNVNLPGLTESGWI